MKLRSILATSVALISVAQLASAAAANNQYDTFTGVTTLTINQDTVVGGNAIGAAGAGNGFSVTGPIDTLQINQSGGANTLNGKGIVMNGASTNTNKLAVTESGSGNNAVTLNLGQTTPLGGLTGSILLSNSASATANTMSETVDTAGVLNYAVTINGGTSNSITDAIKATGNVSNTMNITSNSNTVANNLSGTGSIASAALNYTIAGGNDTITANTNTAGIAYGAQSYTVNMNGKGNNSFTQNVTAAGDQTTNAQFLGTTQFVDFTLNSAAGAAQSAITLNNVQATAGSHALVAVNQGAGSQVTATVNGASYAPGTIGGVAGADTVSISSVAGGVVNTSFTATAPGWSFSSSN